MVNLRDPGLCCVATTGDRCGEGAVWHPEHRVVYWTDINRFLIHRYDLVTNSVRTWFFDRPVTALALTENASTLAVVMGSGLILWRPEDDHRSEPLFELPGWPYVRCNDARVDPAGRLWIGSMRNNVQPDGAPSPAGGKDGVLYRIDETGAETAWVKDIGISNTLAWSPNHEKFYFADTFENRIWEYDFDIESSTISGRQDFFDKFDRGLPDGSDIDDQGFLWNCRYGGGCIVRVAPSGEIDTVIELPVKNPTTCVFGGDDRSTLFITSAACDSTPSDRLAGCLFTFNAGVQGLEPNRFRYRSV